MIKFSPAYTRRIAATLLVLFTFPTLWFALRSYGSFELLRSAYTAGAPQTSSIRGWMTLSYVARTYRVDLPALIDGLGLAPDTDSNTDLRAAAARLRISTFEFVERVQRRVAELAGRGTERVATETSGWFGALSDEVLSAMLVHGYSILALIELFGAIGAPVPDGIAGAVAGSLAAQNRMSLLAASLVIVATSLLGDLAGYAIGRLISRNVLDRYGRWFGYTTARSGRIERLFANWGVITVFLTRTFVSYLSSAANLLAGATRYGLIEFLGVALVGRMLWTAAYLGLGYIIGNDFAAATGFLANLSGLLLSGAVFFIAGWIAIVGRHRSSLPTPVA